MPNFLNKKNKCITYHGDVVIHQNRMSMTGKMVRDKAFFMAKRFDGKLYDAITGTPAQCTISGTRYGIVNGVVTAFGPNIPPVEDKGLRACPAFTQLAQKTEDLSTWTKYNSTVTVSLDGSIRGVNRLFIADTSTTNVHYIERATPFGTVLDNSYTNISCVVKYVGRNIRLYVLTKDSAIKTIFFDLKNGSIQIQESNTFASITSLGNGYYQIFFSVFHGTGTTAVASNILLTDDSFNTSYTGDISKGFFISELSYTNTIIPFIPPYVPNNTSSSVSVVSEAATSTTGTSFDLDDAKLIKLKEGLRGKAVGANLWGTPAITTPPWTDNGTHYVCDGTNNNATLSCPGVLSTGKLYEITFTTGAVTGGVLSVWVGGIPIFNSTPTAGTTYTLRTATPTASTNDATFTNSNTFIGQIRKDIVVKEVQAQGHIELEFESNVDSEWLPSGVSTLLNMFSVANNQVFGSLYFQKDPSGVLFCKLYDGTKNPYVTISTLTVGQTFKISLDYGTYTDGTQKMRLTVNDVRSSVVAFSGSFGAQDLKFFFGNTVHLGWIKKDSLKYYERPRW